MLLLIFVAGIAFFIATYLVNNNKKKTYKYCDGCQKILTGKYIQISAEDLKRSLRYCSADCKAKHHERNKLKFVDMEVE